MNEAIKRSKDMAMVEGIIYDGLYCKSMKQATMLDSETGKCLMLMTDGKGCSNSCGCDCNDEPKPVIIIEKSALSPPSSEDIAKVEELIALGDSLQWSDELTTAGRLIVNALPTLRRLCGSVPTEQPQIAFTVDNIARRLFNRCESCGDWEDIKKLILTILESD